MRKMVYMRRELSESAAMDYVTRYENVHRNLVSSSDARDTLYNSIESSELEVICIVGLQEKLRDDVEPFISKLSSCGINTWMLSGDNYENNLGVAYQLGFIESESQICHLHSDDSDCKRVILLNCTYLTCLLLDSAKATAKTITVEVQKQFRESRRWQHCYEWISNCWGATKP